MFFAEEHKRMSVENELEKLKLQHQQLKRDYKFQNDDNLKLRDVITKLNNENMK